MQASEFVVAHQTECKSFDFLRRIKMTKEVTAQIKKKYMTVTGGHPPTFQTT